MTSSLDPHWKTNKDAARRLFVIEGHSVRVVAEMLAVPVRNVARWQREGRWTDKRRAYAGRARKTAQVSKQFRKAQEQTLGKLLRAVQGMKAETPEQAEALARATYMLAAAKQTENDATIQERLEFALKALVESQVKKGTT